MSTSPDPEQTARDAIEKVTAFILRPSTTGHDLLVFQHPFGGIQIPASTVEVGETPEDTVLRETFEETSLRDVKIVRFLGARNVAYVTRSPR